VASGNKFFHRRTTCGNAFLQAVQLCQLPVEIFFYKSVFKNRKKKFNSKEGLLANRSPVGRVFFRVKSRATRSVGFEPETSSSHVVFSTTPTII
jgi:hypothetical protein